MKKTLATLLVGAMVVGYFFQQDVPAPQPVGDTLQKDLLIAEKLNQEESIFAEINPDTGEVIRTMVITQEELNKGRHGNPANFVRTSKEGTIRKNYAGKGMKYDTTRDAFVPPKVDPNAIFNEEKAQWETPIVISTKATTTK